MAKIQKEASSVQPSLPHPDGDEVQEQQKAGKLGSKSVKDVIPPTDTAFPRKTSDGTHQIRGNEEARKVSVVPDNGEENHHVNTNEPDISATGTQPGVPHTTKRSDIGGKGFFLSTMQQLGIPVPEFECVDTSLIEAIENYPVGPAIIRQYFPGANGTCMADIKQMIDDQPPEIKRQQLEQLANMLTSDAFYQSVSSTAAANTIRSIYYGRLNTEQDGNTAIPVIVRSSSVKEDSYGESQAGKYDSMVKGAEDIVQTCLKVMASGYRAHAVSAEVVPPPMPLVLQRCVDCQRGGVVISYSSLNDKTIRINSAPGQPRTAVSGDNGITPDLHCINRDGGKPVVDFTPGTIGETFVLKSHKGNYVEKRVSTKKLSGNTLSDKHIIELTQYVNTLESRLLCPVDVEFGIDQSDRLFILQVRPLTRLPGAMKFDSSPDAQNVLKGTVVSEGFCSGALYHADGRSSILKSGNIVVADHFHDGMLEPEFLDKVGGFILNTAD